MKITMNCKQAHEWSVVRRGSFHHQIFTKETNSMPLVADVHTGDNDANLLGAAPDLLAALEALLDATNGALKFQRPKVLFAARAAIAKAKG